MEAIAAEEEEDTKVKDKEKEGGWARDLTGVGGNLGAWGWSFDRKKINQCTEGDNLSGKVTRFQPLVVSRITIYKSNVQRESKVSNSITSQWVQPFRWRAFSSGALPLRLQPWCPPPPRRSCPASLPLPSLLPSLLGASTPSSRFVSHGVCVFLGRSRPVCKLCLTPAYQEGSPHENSHTHTHTSKNASGVPSMMWWLASQWKASLIVSVCVCVCVCMWGGLPIILYIAHRRKWRVKRSVQ